MKTYSISKQFVIVRAESADTQGICSLLEMHHPPDFGPPVHYHLKEDEGFYVLEGRYRFRLGEKTLEVGPGDFVLAPREVPHAFRSLGPETGKLLVSFTPGGAERYFELMSQISMEDPDRMKKCQELDREFGMVIIGGFVSFTGSVQKA